MYDNPSLDGNIIYQYYLGARHLQTEKPLLLFQRYVILLFYSLQLFRRWFQKPKQTTEINLTTMNKAMYRFSKNKNIYTMFYSFLQN